MPGHGAIDVAALHGGHVEEGVAIHLQEPVAVVRVVHREVVVEREHAEGAEPSLLGNWHYEVWGTKLANKLIRTG